MIWTKTTHIAPLPSVGPICPRSTFNIILYANIYLRVRLSAKLFSIINSLHSAWLFSYWYRFSSNELYKQNYTRSMPLESVILINDDLTKRILSDIYECKIVFSYTYMYIYMCVYIKLE